LNVLVIAQYFPPDLGGAATRAYNVAKGLVLNRCKVTVVAAFPHYPHGKIPAQYRWRLGKIEWQGKIRVVRTFIFPLESRGLANRMLLFVSFAVSSLFVLLLVGKIDVIWAANPDILSLIPAIIFSKVKRSPMVSNVDDLVLEDLYDLKLIKKGSAISKVAELLARICYVQADALTPISPGYVDTIRKYGVEKNKIHVVRSGVDLATFNPSACQHDPEKFTVLYSGAFSVAYNFEPVFKTAKILETKDRGIEFILQGKGELADYIRSKIKEMNLRNVRMINKLLSRQEVAELLNQASALILPLADFGKPYLGMSSKLYEFQAVGKPIICCGEGQPADYVKKTDSGIVVKLGDHEALAQAVLRLKENPATAKSMGESGRQYVEKNMSLEKIGFEMKMVLKAASAKKSRVNHQHVSWLHF